MDITTYKGRPISFLLMNLHIICTNKLVGDHLVLKKGPFSGTSRSNLELIDALGPGRRILIKSCTQALTVKCKQNIVPHFFANITEHFLEIMQ